MAPRTPKFTPGFAAGVLIVDGQYILAVSRQPRNPSRHYDWGLPGGHAEPFEAPYDTAARELLEETGLRTTGLAPLLTVPESVTGGKPFHVYRPTGPLLGVPVKETKEGVVRWVSPEFFVRFWSEQYTVMESNRYILYWGLGWIV